MIGGQMCHLSIEVPGNECSTEWLEKVENY